MEQKAITSPFLQWLRKLQRLILDLNVICRTRVKKIKAGDGPRKV